MRFTADTKLWKACCVQSGKSDGIHARAVCNAQLAGKTQYMLERLVLVRDILSVHKVASKQARKQL